METPLRFVLRYDPVFLELGWRLRRGDWGTPGGVSLSAVASGADAEREVLAFAALLFGMPDGATLARQGPLSRSVYAYAGFAVMIECVAAPEALRYGRAAAVAGSMACSRAMVEFRLGSDRLLAAALDGDRRYRASLAEGDGVRYRRMDEESPGGSAVASSSADAEALAGADSLLATGRWR